PAQQHCPRASQDALCNILGTKCLGVTQVKCDGGQRVSGSDTTKESRPGLGGNEQGGPNGAKAGACTSSHHTTVSSSSSSGDPDEEAGDMPPPPEDLFAAWHKHKARKQQAEDASRAEREEADEWATGTQDEQPSAGGHRADGGGRGPSIAVQLVDLADATGCEFFHDEEGEAWVTFPVLLHRETTRVNAGAFWDWLEHRFHGITGRTANASAKQEAQGVFRGRAKFDGEQHAVHVRLAEHRESGATYLDL